MSRVANVVTQDTGRDITALINDAAAQHDFDPLGFLGGALAESNLCEQARRERPWPDVSYGLWQPTVKWLGQEVEGLTRAGDGTALDLPANRLAAQTFCFDAARLVAYVAPRYAALLRRWGDPLEAWCRWNKPSMPGTDNPHRATYADGLRRAAAFAASDDDSTPTPVQEVPPDMDPKILAWQALWRLQVPEAKYNHDFGFEQAWREHQEEWGVPLEAEEFPVEIDGQRYQARNFHKAGLVYWKPDEGAIVFGRPL